MPNTNNAVTTELTLPTPTIELYLNNLPYYTVKQYDPGKLLGYMVEYAIDFKQEHPWFARERDRYQFHPAIKAAIKLSWPINAQTLIEQWPHVSTEDKSRLAYTRSHEHGVADRQTVTSISKYLRAHFPALSDHQIRDIAALYAVADTFKIVDTMDGADGMLDVLYRGPHSCMVDTSECEAFDEHHPYRAYDPQYGWKMAVRMRGTRVMGRALVNTIDGAKIYVRTYARFDDNEHSTSNVPDNALQAWLGEQGFVKRSGWTGCKLAKIYAGLDYRNFEYVVPYLDGECQRVDERDDYLLIDPQGEWLCNNTNGDADANGMECPCCERRVHEDDMVGVGVYCDDSVCSDCITDSYTLVCGRRGEEYYIPDDEVVEADGCMYDPDYLSDNDIVELHNGDYTHLDNAVFVESANAYYLSDSIDIVYAQDTEAYELREDCWQCNQSDMWYTNEVDYVEVDGITYHPDNAPEVETEDN